MRTAKIFKSGGSMAIRMPKPTQKSTAVKDKNRNAGEIDMQLATTAIANNLTLITNNEKDFNYIEILNTQNWGKYPSLYLHFIFCHNSVYL
ncbi:hypothetical protein B9N64_04785 [Campylobacter concisus]|jgi:toxin of toxin-antitoxin system|uniref:hypothetical protein n=1 Tax=Campylobacter concisus TaxID=199 RepID=UPI000B3D65F3|nr:hypothetical protein [Campylobacter concisus]OUT14028.1 hypothetical protein B9N64_04785 [Campylobacter concisus]